MNNNLLYARAFALLLVAGLIVCVPSLTHIGVVIIACSFAVVDLIIAARGSNLG